jgi:hypothetical protein
MKAARVVLNALRANLSNAEKSAPGEFPGLNSGDMLKGAMLKNSDLEQEVKVGFGPPAHHAHLMEFGTAHRVDRNGKDRGQVLPRPVLGPTFEQEADNVGQILSEKWL